MLTVRTLLENIQAIYLPAIASSHTNI